jgi:hypothetical protein
MVLADRPGHPSASQSLAAFRAVQLAGDVVVIPMATSARNPRNWSWTAAVVAAETSLRMRLPCGPYPKHTSPPHRRGQLRCMSVSRQAPACSKQMLATPLPRR